MTSAAGGKIHGLVLHLSDCEQVSAHPQHRGLRLHQPSQAQKCLSLPRVGYPCRYIREDPTGALESIHSPHIETGSTDLVAQLVGPMKVRRGEVIELARGVPVLPIPKI